MMVEVVVMMMTAVVIMMMIMMPDLMVEMLKQTTLQRHLCLHWHAVAM